MRNHEGWLPLRGWWLRIFLCALPVFCLVIAAVLGRASPASLLIAASPILPGAGLVLLARKLWKAGYPDMAVVMLLFTLVPLWLVALVLATLVNGAPSF